MAEKTIKYNRALIIGLFLLGIILRFFVMTLGHNFDFESYCIVGKIASNFDNVYAETFRYNYGPIFFCIQGLLYKISQLIGNDWMTAYRILIVSFLTLVDFLIAMWIYKKHTISYALLFFLNPISIIITGYHNQFDNIAIWLVLLSCQVYNDAKRFSKKDLIFIILLSLSLVSKHICFFLPFFILFRHDISLDKKVVYACVPPMVFLLSFIPFVVNDKQALEGVVKNVFLYRSFNNSPFLLIFYRILGIPENVYFIVFLVFMLCVGFLSRKCTYEKQVMIYLIALVAFSSAITNQYLVIPLVALCVLETGVWKYFYIIVIGVVLILTGDGLGMLTWFQTHFEKLGIVLEWYVKGRYIIAAWILFITLCYLYKKELRRCLDFNGEASL